MKKFLKIYFLSSLVIGAILIIFNHFKQLDPIDPTLVFNKAYFLSYTLGTTTCLFSICLLAFILVSAFKKKQIALSIPLIVSKYAIIGGFMYFASHQSWFLWTYYILGTLNLTTSALVYAITLKRSPKK